MGIFLSFLFKFSQLSFYFYYFFIVLHASCSLCNLVHIEDFLQNIFLIF